MSKLIFKKKSAKVIWAKSAAYLVGEWLGGKKNVFARWNKLVTVWLFPFVFVSQSI